MEQMSRDFMVTFTLSEEKELRLLFYPDRDEWNLCRRNSMLRGDAVSYKISSQSAHALMSGMRGTVYKVHDIP
jgi:hypothetical protein